MNRICQNCVAFRAKGDALSYLDLKLIKPLGICVLHAEIICVIQHGDIPSESPTCPFWTGREK
jgi:hypothetical protein